MVGVLILLAGYLVVLFVLVGVAAGIGLLLHWAIPGVDANTGLLVGTAYVLASVFVVLGTFRLLWSVIRVERGEPESDENGEEEEGDDEDEDSPHSSVNAPVFIPRRHRTRSKR